MRVVNKTNQKELANELVVADNLFARIKGLLGKSSLSSGEGLWIKPCKGVHTFGMKFPIDVIFLNRSNSVVAVMENLPPNRMTRIVWKSSTALELPAGTIHASATSEGDELDIERQYENVK